MRGIVVRCARCSWSKRSIPADDAAFDAWFAVMQVTDAERWPDGPGWQRVERLAMALDEDGPEEHRLLVARDGAGAVRGIADIELYRRENPQLARTEVRVLPTSRRHGIGSALLAAVEQIVVGGGADRTGRGGRDAGAGRTTKTPPARSRRITVSPGPSRWCAASCGCP